MATLSVEDFLAKARPLNPDYSDDELIQAYHEQYTPRPTQTVSPEPLMTLDQFMPKARALNPGYSDEELQQAWQEKYGARGARETEQGDVGRGFTTAFKQIPQLVGGLEAGAGAVGEKVFGEGGLFTALKNHGLKNYQEAEAEIAKDSKPSDSVTEAYNMARAGNPGALVDWLQYALGYGGGQAVQMLATAGIGMAAGKLALQPAAKLVAEKMIAKETARLAATGVAGEALAKQAVSNVAGKIGQIGALGATAVGMEGGEIYGGLVEKAAEEGRSLTGHELAKAAGATLGAGALEFVGDKIGLDLVLGKSVAGRLVTSRLGHAAAAGSVGVATEGGTEFSQTLLEEFGKGNDPFSPDSVRQAVDAAALGGVTGGAIGTAGGLARRPERQTTVPEVTERKPEELGLPSQQPDILEPVAPRQLTGPPQPGEVRAGTVYGGGDVLDVSPLPDVTPITQASSLDEAIAGAVGVVQGATEIGKARAAEFARMTAKAKNETDQLLASAPQKRAGAEIPILPGPDTTAPALLNQPSLIVPGQAFTPRPEPEPDPRARLADERARMITAREQQAQVSQPTEQPEEPGAIQNVPLRTAQEASLAKAYPSVSDLHALASEKGLDSETPTFHQYTKMVTGVPKLDDLTPVQREQLATAMAKIKPTVPPKTESAAPVQEPQNVEAPPPSVPLTPIKERPYAPVSTIPEAQVPRSELTPEKSADETASWVIRNKETGEVIQETYNPQSVENLNKSKYEAVPVQEYLGSINTEEKRQANADRFKDVARGTVQPSREVPPIKVPPSRTERLAQEKQKMDGTKPKNAIDLIDRMYRDILDDTKVVHRMQREQKGQWATVKRVDAAIKAGVQAGLDYDAAAAQVPTEDLTALAEILGTSEEKPTQVETKPPQAETVTPEPETGEPFALTSPTVKEAKPKEDDRQTSLDIPPETIGARPIIGREAQPEEAPLLSKAAQEPAVEQTDLATIAPNSADIAPEQPESAQSPTEILASALRTAADKIQGKKIEDVGEKIGGARKDLAPRGEEKPETKETDTGTALYNERAENTREAPTKEQFAKGFRDGLPIHGTDQLLVDTSQEYPADMLRKLSTKRYVRKLTAELSRVFSAMKRVLVGSDQAFQNISFAAISMDSYYYGVNDRGPDRVAVNPWTAMHEAQKAVQAGRITESQVPDYLAGFLIDVMVHEFTHQQVITTHTDAHQAEFDQAEERNHAILGTRLTMLQRQLVTVLTGGSNGAIEGIREDLRQQQAFWGKGIGVSASDRPVTSEPTYARRRQGESGEGTSGRTGPPEDLFGRRELKTASLDESAGLQRSGSVTGTIDPGETRDALKTSKKSLRPYLLGSLGLEQLSQVYGDDHAEVKRYNKATQAMEADFVEMSRSSDHIVKAWTKLKIPVADKMARVMEDARFLNFDPDPSPVDSSGEARLVQEADSQKKKDLRLRFEQLPSEAQGVYRQARDFYTTMAEDRFQALKERIERAGGTPENTKKLVDRLQIAYEQVRSKVYFPFSRFGENIVVAKKMENGVEQDREVHAFESVSEAQQFATLMKMKGWQVKQTVARQYSVDKDGAASKIVRQMHDIIKELGQGQQGLPGVMDLEDQLLDSLNQSFLQALPDMSYAKHFIHAKDVKGASKDALRAFAHSALHGAHHISRIRHADKLTTALMDLDTRVNETAEGDVTEARQVYNELVHRHNEILNPSTHPVAAWLGQLGFTMSLGGVVATGVTNATQVPLITFPWLGARFGFGKASAALTRAYKDFLDLHTLNKESLFDATKSKRVSESEKKMLTELARRGRIDLTQTMDLAGLSGHDNLSRRARLTGTLNDKIARMLGFTFHTPEVMNRQVTALAAFRLEKDLGKSYDEALQRAEQAIIDTHFIYTAENRARYMSGNVLRVLTMFKQYSQNIAFLYGRAASIWMDKNNMSQDERDVAKRQVLSMLVLQFGAAGALGMPFFGAATDLLMSVVGAFGDDDDKRDWEVSLRQWLDGTAVSLAESVIDDKETARAVGKKAGEVVSHGASRLTPWDMSARLGQQDLFFRAPQREREGRAAMLDWLTALGGPVPGYLTNAYLGVGDLAKGIKELNAGFFMRGVEELTPAVLRNSVKSLRYAMEDVRTRDEYKQLELNQSETLGQFFGFTPSRVSEMYESTTAVKNKEHRIVREKKTLLDRFARSIEEQDEDRRQAILEDIRDFNARNPMFALTSDSLNRSIKSRRQHEAGMERGMYLPPRRRELMEEGDFGNF